MRRLSIAAVCGLVLVTAAPNTVHGYRASVFSLRPTATRRAWQLPILSALAPSSTPIVPGGEVGFQWGPGGTTPVGVDEFHWNLTVQALNDPQEFIYWATQVYWQFPPAGGGGVAYFGLQPNG